MNWNLVQKYLSKTCTDAEQKEVDRWLQKDERHKQFMNSMKQVWNVEPASKETVDVEKAWKKFQTDHLTNQKGDTAKVDQGMPVLRALHHRKRQKWYAKTSFYTAAAVIALLITAIFLTKAYYGSPEPSKPTFQVIATNAGEKASITLGDGIKVRLNAESKLKIPSHHEVDERNLYLVKGEAFFNVKHDPSRHLVIHAGNSTIRDIGTRFDVNTYGKGTKISVVVAEGRLKVAGEKNNHSVSLSANERAVVSDKKITVHPVANLAVFTGWTQNKMIFENTPFKKVIRRLERQYNVMCRVKDLSIFNQHLTATFNNTSLDGVLLLIRESMNINTKKEGRTIIFNTK